MQIESRRLQNPQYIVMAEAAAAVTDGTLRVIQFDRPPTNDAVLEQIDDLCIQFGDALEVRFYGWGFESFDARIVGRMPNVGSLSIDCLQKIEREDTIASLSKLRKLTFGVYDFDRPGFMGIFASEQFKELNLLENRKRNFDLSPLADFHGIETLLISGHWKGVEAITTLPKLDTLTLSSFPNRQNLMFLNKCHALRHLRLLLGSRNSIAEFSHAHLERFHVCWVRGLEDLGPIGRFPRLKELSIEDQLRVEQIDVSGSRG